MAGPPRPAANGCASRDLGEQGGLDAKLAKFGTEAKAASAKVTDLDSFKAQMGEVGKNCGGCHQPYRERQSSTG